MRRADRHRDSGETIRPARERVGRVIALPGIRILVDDSGEPYGVQTPDPLPSRGASRVLDQYPTDYSSSELVRRLNFGRWVTLLAVPVTLVSILLFQHSQEANANRPVEKTVYDCEFDTSQTFDHVYGAEGVDHVVHLIHGTGNGSGDPCFDKARELVRNLNEASYGQEIPLYGQTVRNVPVAVSAVEK